MISTSLRYSYNLAGEVESGVVDIKHEFDSVEELKRMIAKHWFNLDHLDKIISVVITPDPSFSYAITLREIKNDDTV